MFSPDDGANARGTDNRKDECLYQNVVVIYPVNGEQRTLTQFGGSSSVAAVDSGHVTHANFSTDIPHSSSHRWEPFCAFEHLSLLGYVFYTNNDYTVELKLPKNAFKGTLCKIHQYLLLETEHIICKHAVLKWCEFSVAKNETFIPTKGGPFMEAAMLFSHLFSRCKQTAVSPLSFQTLKTAWPIRTPFFSMNWKESMKMCFLATELIFYILSL